MPPRRHLRTAIAVAACAILVAAIGGCATQPSAEVAVRAFLLDWQAGEYEAAAGQTDGDTGEVAGALRRAHDELDLAALRFGLGPITADGDHASAKFHAEADLGIGDPVWKYTGSMSLKRGGNGWRVAWSPDIVHPKLGRDERLAVSYDVPDRGRIYDRNDKPLVAKDRVTVFGVVPAKMDDMEKGVGRLARVLDEDSKPLLNRVRSAPPGEFQPLVLMRHKDAKSAMVSKAKKIPGVGTTKLRIPLSPKAAKAVVGDVAGTTEHKISSRVDSTYQAGDTVGLGGLQNVFQQRLAGTATTKVVTLGKDGTQTGVLKSWPGMESDAVSTTLDTTAQEASVGAMKTMPGAGYMVALDARNGEILAAAGKPDSVDNDGAFTKEYRPGEAFTIVSTAAALKSGAVKADQGVPCDRKKKVGGRTFTNPNDSSLYGRPDLARDFAYTCTTAFAGLGEKVSPKALDSAADEFGLNTDWRLSVPTFNGDFTEPETKAQTASAMVGRGQVRVSPLSMALVAGGVASGTWHAPRLVHDDVKGQKGQDRPASRKLDPDTVKRMRAMMRSTVENGRATTANVGSLPVNGQMSSATQMVDGKKTAVQWFVGYQGNLAFAVAAEAHPQRQWNHYAVTSGAEFLQRLPYDYVEKLSSTKDKGSGEDSESGGGSVPGRD